MKLLMYLRRSQDSEDRQVLSIPAQERVLSELAAKRGFTVLGEPYRESMTAKQPGRPLFGDMMTRLKRGEADGVLCWKVDRLARNPVDAGDVIWNLGQKKFTIIVTTETDYTGSSDDKLFMSIMFGMATKYIDDLSENVKRGNREALENGFWPASPKFGYMRDPVTRKQVPDPERYPGLMRLFRLRLSGLPMSDLLRVAEHDLHLRTRPTRSRGGHPLWMSRLYEVLRDPFYMGVMVYQGKQYKGNHEPMLTFDEHEKIVRGLGRHDLAAQPKPKSLVFTYRGLIRCGCGALVTAEKQRNKRYGYVYYYYRCCKKTRPYRCPEQYVREDKIEAQLQAFFSRLVVPPDVAKAVANAVRTTETERLALSNATRLSAQRDLDSANRRIERLTAMRIDEELSAAEFATLRADADARKLAAERALQEQCDQLSNHDAADRILGWVDFGNRAAAEFASADPHRKRELVSLLLSNLELRHGILLCVAKKPLSWFLDCPAFRPGWAWMESNHRPLHYQCNALAN